MNRRISAEEIYDALFDDAAFEALPKRIAGAIGARSAILGWIYPDGSQSFLGSCGYFSPENIEDYLRDFAATDPWTAAADPLTNPAGLHRAVDMDEHVPSSVWVSSPLYNDFFRAIGDDTYRALAVPSQNRWGRGNIALHMGKGSKGFDPAAVHELDGMGRHIGRMLGLRARMNALELQLSASRSMLDHIPQAALLVSGTSQILHANAAAELLLAKGELLRSSDGHLRVAGGQSRQVRDAVAAALDPAEPRPTALLLQSSARPLLVTVIPMKVSAGNRQALLLARELLVPQEGISRLLQQLFQLTRAEAGVTSLLAGGATLQQIADARAVSVATVRAQFKAVAAKLGCSRQAEVVALVNGLDSARL